MEPTTTNHQQLTQARLSLIRLFRNSRSLPAFNNACAADVTYNRVVDYFQHRVLQQNCQSSALLLIHLQSYRQALADVLFYRG